MGREIQKRKARSSAQKIRQKPKSKKRVLSNPIVAAAWDSKQTLTQNYKRLGLASKLNKHTGGVERKAGDTATRGADALSIAAARRTEQLDVGEARIERDAETGRIVRVLDQEGTGSRENPLGDLLNELDDGSDGEEMMAQKQASWASLANQHGNVAAGSYVDHSPQTSVVRELEARANQPKEKYQRKQTENEKAFVEELVRKYGEDYGRMARDMKINYMQRSEGDLKRRVKKWQEAGGRIEGEE